MAAVTDAPPAAELNLLGGLLVAVVVGGGLAAAGRVSALALLIAVAVAQGLLAFAWTFGTAIPGRWGGLIVGALAASGADVTASVWPHGRLGTMVAVLGLAVPVMFVHQLTRGAARVQVVSSLAAVAALVVAEVALSALLQLRHEFGGSVSAGHVTEAMILAAAGGLVIGYFVDFVVPTPRFDPDVPRGLLGVVAAAALGAAAGYLVLETNHDFAHGRGAFAGAAVGALVGLLAVAATFVLHTTPQPGSALGRRLRPAVGALMPLAVVAPAAFLLCLAIRS